MNELSPSNSNIEETISLPKFTVIFGDDNQLISEHKSWLRSIRHESPSTNTPYKVGIYIRYFNQTKYENYLDNHKQSFLDALALCPKWTLVDFYIDTGSVAPHMESAPEWTRLMNDCMDKKVDLIITQKVSNVSRDPKELTICARILAAQNPPIGIYFLSEDIFTTASYYMADLHDYDFAPELQELANNETEGYLND